MARFKFLVFAVLVLAVWAAHLALLTPPLAERAVEQAVASARTGRLLAQARLIERRQLLRRLAIKLASDSKFSAVSSGHDPKALRAMAVELAPQSMRAALVVGFASDGKGSFLRGDEAVQGLDPALGQAGGDGMVENAFGSPYYFVSIGPAVLGTPLVDSGLTDAVAEDGSLAAVGLFQGGKLLQGGGAEKSALEAAAKAARLGSGSVVSTGAAISLGPLKLPLFATGMMKLTGDVPLLVASREAVDDTPFEVISLASVHPIMGALATYQQLAMGVFALLTALSLVWAKVAFKSPSPKDDDDRDEQPRDPMEARTGEKTPPPSAPNTDEPEPPSGATEIQPPLSESPSSFDSPSDSPSAYDAPPYDPSTEPPPYDPAALESPPPEPPPEPATGADAPSNGASAHDPFAAPARPPEDLESTKAYPTDGSLQPWSSDPNEPYNGTDYSGSDNPEATRVAVISPELINAMNPSAQESTGGSGPHEAPAPPPQIAVAQPSAEDMHFQEVFKDFLATKQKCGEASDAVTYEKFVVKLRKNKDQLVQKYNCKSVRFQVYVKEGKAALKATPVKE